MDALARLPPLRDTISAHGLDARKQLGQHFLLDLNLTRRIARSAAPLHDGTTIEIGPGPGGLTRALLMEGAGRVVAIEVDRRAIAALAELQQAADGRLDIIEADALAIDIASLGPPPRRIVANLPYNVSTPLLLNWLHAADAVADMVLMFQKEVVDRLIARPPQQGLRSPVGDRPARLQRAPPVRHRPVGLRAPAQGDVVRSPPDPAPNRPAPGRPRSSRTRHRRRLRPAPQDAARLAVELFDDPTSLLQSLALSPTGRAEELSVSDFVRLAAKVS